MKRIYLTAVLAAGVVFSTSAFAQTSCPPRLCGFNGVSVNGVKTEENGAEDKKSIKSAASAGQVQLSVNTENDSVKVSELRLTDAHVWIPAAR